MFLSAMTFPLSLHCYLSFSLFIIVVVIASVVLEGTVPLLPLEVVLYS